MNEKYDTDRLVLSSQRDMIEKCVLSLETITAQGTIENILTRTFESAPDNIIPDSDQYYSVFNYYLYKYILKHYRHKRGEVCFWRFIKNLSNE